MKIEKGITATIDGSRNDCTVRALANAFNMPYYDAALKCKEFGRKRKNCGMKGPQVVAMLNSLGGKHRVDLAQSWAMLSINSMDPSKTYYVVVWGHAFAVKRGVILDSNDGTKWLRRFGRKQVLYVWEVPNAEPMQLPLFESWRTA